MIYLAIVLLILLFIAIIFLFTIIFNSLIFGHGITSHSNAIELLYKIIKANNLEEKKFYDLGSAWGRLSIKTQKKFPKLQILAIEDDRLRIFVSKLLQIIFRTKVQFFHDDLFNIDFKNADILFAYLWHTLLPQLEKKFLEQAKPGTIIITHETFFPNLKPNKIITLHPNKKNSEKLFIYKK
ncbi:hypothetical protein HN858_01515 [Candidatus Falkowbacteria bacterium]|jgi:hypothetical protein|nr:hypothetical protein [Candidatus Falkowbacteria bacterium]MBT5503791.1 hypothetical protein [Candidatus Falkowbacteria bacterium]MBT6573921.1 hypothetical protein [Candidatus Falkowbacteria bacterium]MBT7348332.1 hypothetical protein [Candidatus Falkowbacteria bacterium]MBT7500285.1 hypothetical protein [Candidatus Falkowbacteria bacterium]